MCCATLHVTVVTTCIAALDFSSLAEIEIATADHR